MTIKKGGLWVLIAFHYAMQFQLSLVLMIRSLIGCEIYLVIKHQIKFIPAFGGATSISVMSNGFFASQATAALHLITWPWVAANWFLRDSGSLDAADDIALRMIFPAANDNMF